MSRLTVSNGERTYQLTRMFYVSRLASPMQVKAVNTVSSRLYRTFVLFQVV